MIEVAVSLNGLGIQHLEIANRATSFPLPEMSDYDYRFGSPELGGAVTWGPWYVLRGHCRRDGVWRLIDLVLVRVRDGDEEASDYGSR